ncbi:hypothetical protein H2200_005459 [Cladophialophora chaetospira]|uniref:Uncharacterized protein n=1 Tax=Cladophialophora chaetospira TaxID=386627 RepID=A0AA39CJM0_9EURO|nr:hypothetical protein H2200_005459 [Cladophialophora chaetospira]
MSSLAIIRDLAPGLATFSTPFYRFAPLGYRKFVAVGLRSAAVKLHDNRVLVLNPIQLEKSVHDKLTAMGGVHFVASDLGHHLYVKDYLDTWPDAKAIGVKGLEGKRKDVKWNFVYENAQRKPEDVFGFSEDVESVMFEGFITRAVAWYHRPSGTLIQSDLLMNLPCTEQYKPSSSDTGPLSRGFATLAYPQSLFHRALLYYAATTDYSLMRRDAKKVAEWNVQRIVPCHGENIEGKKASEAWKSAYSWFLDGPASPSLFRRIGDTMNTIARRLFLL